MVLNIIAKVYKQSIFIKCFIINFMFLSLTYGKYLAQKIKLKIN